MSRESWFRRLGRPLAASALAIVVALGMTRGRDAALSPPPSALGSAPATVPAAPAAPPVSAPASVPHASGAGNVAAPAPEERPVRRFTITVMDDAKTPVAKATVHLHHGFDATTSIYRKRVSVDTDDSGVARFSLVVEGDHVVVRAQRHGAVGWSRRIPASELDHESSVYIGPSVMLSGRVAQAAPDTRVFIERDEDLKPGTPLRGATVVMDIPTGDEQAWRDRNPVRWGVKADADGRVLLPAVRSFEGSTHVRLHVSAAGHADESFTHFLFSADVDPESILGRMNLGAPEPAQARPVMLQRHFGTVLLSPTRSVRGRCVSVSGKPIAGLLIAVGGRDLATRSRRDGTFELTGVPDRPVAIVFRRPGNVMRALSLPTGGDVDLGDVRAGLGSMITGVVLDGEGVPAAGVFVNALQAGELATAATTDAKGRFSLIGPPVGEVDLVAWTGPPTDLPDEVSLVAQVPAVDGARDVEIRLPGVATLRLTVVDETTGKPVTGCSLTVHMQGVDRPDVREALEYAETLRGLSVARRRDFVLDGAPVDLHFEAHSAESADLVLHADSKLCGYGDVDLRGCAPGKITERTVSVLLHQR